MSDTRDDERATGPWAAQPLWEAAGLDRQDLPRGLYVVATPIGNAADVSLRALWVLRNADCIAAEDTRVTSALLQRYGIRARLSALHRHNERQASAPLLELLAEGRRVALVSDAGTPGLSDPGAVLVRAALEAGHRVIPVPGASSATAAISAAGLHAATVRLLGFLPDRARARARLLQQAAERDEAFVLFEAPHRIERTAQELAAALEPGRRVVLARELTKLYETIAVTTAAGLPETVARQQGRGEYVVIVDGWTGAEAGDGEAAAQELGDDALRWIQALAPELPAARVAAIVSRVTGIPRERVYAAVLQAQAAGPRATVTRDGS